MKMHAHTLTRLFAGAATAGLIAVISACGGGDYTPPAGTGPTSNMPAGNFAVTTLVADANTTPQYGVTAPHIDAHLVNAWGLAFNPNGFVWVANNGSSSSTLYDGNGVQQTLVVSLQAGQAGSANPTGIVFNGTQDFKISNGGAAAASPFIFAGEGGTLSAWSPSVDAANALTVVDASASGAVYKGLAMASSGGANFLYATDFHNNRVDVYDAQFNHVTMAGNFQDPGLPAGFAPYGIATFGNQIYVSFAKQDAGAHDQITGAGMGYIDQFDTAGHFVKQLVVAGALNAPWGMAMAPANFGAFSGDLLVANFGDGKINAFDPNTGAMVGTISDGSGTPIAIDGLWGIAFGNGLNNQPTNTLFFTAGPADESHGLYGRIDAQ